MATVQAIMVLPVPAAPVATTMVGCGLSRAVMYSRCFSLRGLRAGCLFIAVSMKCEEECEADSEVGDRPYMHSDASSSSSSS